MRIVDEAFIYRLTWAIEAIRMRRRAEGGESAYVEGSAAACLEAGLPSSMMAMLVRAGLPSRVAAREAIEQTKPSFNTRGDMNLWLSSNEITVLSEDLHFPTLATNALWRRFRTDALATPTRRWNEDEWVLETALPSWAKPSTPARIDVDKGSGKVSITSPDYREIVGIKQTLSNPMPSLMHVEYADDRKWATIKRLGQGKASWRD
jgi:hypothetical protein